MGADQPFTLPEDGEHYARLVITRCEDLARTRIWSAIDTLRLRGWLTNFNTPLEIYFAACVLDRLIYRSPEQTHSLIRHLFQRTLPDAESAISVRTAPDWQAALKSQSDPGVRLVPVIRDDDPPTKSGPLVARLMKRHLDLNDKWMIWPWQIKRQRQRGIRTFIFIDDFLGTGDQFLKFSRQMRLPTALDGAVAIYTPLVAHANGVSTLREHLPWIHCAAVETLDESHGLFSPSHTHFANDGTNTPIAAREYYVKLMRSKRWEARCRWILGYGELGLTFAFAHATPNASLPILWKRHRSRTPLFER